MKFYLPFARDPALADHTWRAVRRFLADNGYPTEPRRIWMLGMRQGEDAYRMMEVGRRVPELGEPVFVILKARHIPVYYLCTPNHGVLRGLPWPVILEDDDEVVDFAKGHALPH